MTKNKPVATGAIVTAVVAVLGFLWSWLFGIRVATLSSSMIIGYLCTLFAFSVIVALASVLFVVMIRYFAREYQSKPVTPWFLVRLFLVWAAVEFGVSMLITIVWVGRNGSLDSVLPFSSFTPLLALTPFRFLARFVGFHGLSAAFVVVVCTVAFQKLRGYALAVVALVGFSTVLAWGLYRQPAGPELRTQVVSDHEGAADPVRTTAQLVVLPEYGLNGVANDEIEVRLITPPGQEVFYIGSRRHEVPSGVQNVMVFGSTTKGVVQQRAKTRLIPGGEYLPYAGELPMRLIGAHATLRQFKNTRAVERGSEKVTPLELGPGIKLGSGVCASIIAPKDYRGLTKDGATVLTNSASLGVFKSALFTLQHQGLARFMAAANARPFVQSSSDGLGFVMDHNGQLLKKITPVDTAEVTVQTNSKNTPYTYLGEWPAYLGLVVVVPYLLRLLKRKFR